MRRELFKHIHSLPLLFFKRTKVGDLLSALTTDTENIRMLLAIGALMLVDAVINFVLFPIILWQLSPSLTLFVVPPLLIVALGALVWSDRLSSWYTIAFKNIYSRSQFEGL